MCGIAGSVGSGSGDAQRAAVLRMLDAQRHRGPDGTEIETAGAAVFGHCALRFVEIGRARQPYRTRDGRVLLTFNGEIYNYRSVRERLQRRLGWPTLPAGEAAVLAEWFALDGADIVPQLDGMFAIAIYDARTGETTLVRDRLGKKPLCYVRAPGGVAFASELKALSKHPACSSDVSPSSVAQFLTFGAVVTVGSAGITSRRYWTPTVSMTRSQAGAPEVLAALEAAVERRIPREVPVGVFLSGGLDSGLVAALAQRHLPSPLRTFSLGFDDDPSFDETDAAESVSRHIGTEHTTVRVTRPALARAIARVLGSIDEPVADQSLVPTAILAQTARASVKTVLTGDGADELLMGYNVFLASRAIDTALRIFPASWVKGLLASAGRRRPSDVNLHYAHVAAHLARTVQTPPERRFYVGGAPFERDAWPSILQPEMLAAAEMSDVFADLDALLAQQPALDAMERLQIGMLCHFLRDVILVKVDRATMAASLEARCPFLDPQVVAVALSLSTAAKLGAFSTKKVLRQCAVGLVPDAVVRGRKRGFRNPTAALFRGDLRDYAGDVFGSAAVRAAGIWQPQAVDALIADHDARRHDNHRALWSLLCLGSWLLSLKNEEAP